MTIESLNSQFWQNNHNPEEDKNNKNPDPTWLIFLIFLILIIIFSAINYHFQ